MPTRVKKLSKFQYEGINLTPLFVILDASGSPILLPLMYSAYLALNGVVYESRTFRDHRKGLVNELIAQDVSDNTIRSYIYKLNDFLNYLESSSNLNVHATPLCAESFLNRYINSILPTKLNSPTSLPTHQAALSAYFNWLSYIDLMPTIKFRVHRKTKQSLSEASNRQAYVQYVTRKNRLKLLTACSTLAEKLMMRMGYEVGLRTSELVGLRLDGKGGLKEIFEKIDNPQYEEIERFPYHLHGKYTKGEKSRWIYFDRELVRDMKRYFDTERKKISRESSEKTDALFLRTDSRFKGTAIGDEQASRVFRKRADQAGLNPLLCFHDLRHTFATELFHYEVTGPDGRETRSESSALIIVAKRLGHAFTRGGQAPATTTRYIRMRIEMLQLESEEDSVNES